MTIAVISFTKKGADLSLAIKAALKDESVDLFSTRNCQGVRPLEVSFKQWCETYFEKTDCLIFIGAVAIGVRGIAPYINGKDKDPCVIVVDEKGDYVIPVLSGHLGGGNKLAKRLAEALGSIPVITTATDINRLFAVDVFSKDNGCILVDLGDIKVISSAILHKERVGFYSEVPICEPLPESLTLIAEMDEKKLGVCIAFSREKKPFQKTMNLIPKWVVVGLGCRKGIAFENLETFFLNVLEKNKIDILSIDALVSIDLKKEEPAFLALSEKYGIPLKTYSSKALSEVSGDFTASAFVKTITGVDNVCERSIVCAGAKLWHKKESLDGITLAIGVYQRRLLF